MRLMASRSAHCTANVAKKSTRSEKGGSDSLVILRSLVAFAGSRQTGHARNARLTIAGSIRTNTDWIIPATIWNGLDPSSRRGLTKRKDTQELGSHSVFHLVEADP